MLPLVENNFNLCELGPRSTGKSHLYKEISPNSILVSGGQTTVANHVIVEFKSGIEIQIDE
jgi:ATP-dependent Lon protease